MENFIGNKELLSVVVLPQPIITYFHNYFISSRGWAKSLMNIKTGRLCPLHCCNCCSPAWAGKVPKAFSPSPSTESRL